MGNNKEYILPLKLLKYFSKNTEIILKDSVIFMYESNYATDFNNCLNHKY